MDTTVVPHRVTLRSGHRVLVRAVRLDDGPGLAEAYDQLSETSRYRRVFPRKTPLSPQSPADFPPRRHPPPEGPRAGGPRSRRRGGGGREMPPPPPPAPAAGALA